MALNETNPKKARAIVRLVFGLPITLAAGYYLFFRLNVFHAPELILKFPRAYALVIGLFVTGVYFCAASMITLKRSQRS